MKKTFILTAIIIVAITALTACNTDKTESIAETTEETIVTTAEPTTEEPTTVQSETYSADDYRVEYHNFLIGYDENGDPYIYDATEDVGSAY